MKYRRNKGLERLIAHIAAVDQTDRLKKSNAGLLENEDRTHYAIVKTILAGSIEELSPRAWFSLAMVLHHASTVSNDFARARALASSAAARGYPKATWLWAALYDRQRILQGQPQRYGTQFKVASQTGKRSLQPLDGLCSDAERKRLGLPTIPELTKLLG